MSATEEKEQVKRLQLQALEGPGGCEETGGCRSRGAQGGPACPMTPAPAALPRPTMRPVPTLERRGHTERTGSRQKKDDGDQPCESLCEGAKLDRCSGRTRDPKRSDRLHPGEDRPELPVEFDLHLDLDRPVVQVAHFRKAGATDESIECGADVVVLGGKVSHAGAARHENPVGRFQEVPIGIGLRRPLGQQAGLRCR